MRGYYCYMLVHNEAFGNLAQVKKILDKHPHIQNWYKCLPYSFLVVSDLMAYQLYDSLKKHVIGDSRLLILDTHSDRQGWLPRKAWELMKDPKPGIYVMDADAQSSIVPDWGREKCNVFWDPGRRLLRSIRYYQAWKCRGPFLRWMSKYWVLEHRFWSVVTGSEIPLTCRLGGGLLLTHPNGVVINEHAIIGPNCLIFQQVTIGTRSPDSGAPILGGHVDVGAGAKVLGSVKIGDHAQIGANAVVLQDVPAGATAVGIPARIISKSETHNHIA